MMADGHAPKALASHYVPYALMETDPVEEDQQIERDSQFFDGSLAPTTERGWSFVDVIAGMLDASRKRQPKRSDLAKTRELRATMVANLLVHYFQGSHGSGVVVSRAKHRDKRKETRYSSFVFPRSFPDLIDDLIELRLLTQTVGSYSGMKALSKRTTVRAGARLLALADEHGISRADFSAGSDNVELIHLKRTKRGYGDEGGLQNYEDTDTTRRYRAQMRAINTWLAAADITFDASAHERRVDATQRLLWRAFTNGRWNSGGRLWGGFWQHLPRKARKEGIRIDGETVEGMDYSSINVVLAYWKANAPQPSDDAYTISGLERGLVKTIFNAMLDKDVIKFPKGVPADHNVPRSLKVTSITSAIRAKHTALVPLFGSGIIHALQFHESEILLAALEACRTQGIVALPIHDCLIVKQSNAERVQKIMVTEFKRATGREVSVHADG